MLDKENLEKLNDILNQFVALHFVKEEGIDLSLIDYTEQLLGVFDRNMLTFCVRSYKHKVPIKKSIENALLFLGNLDNEYGEYLEKRLNDGTFNFILLDDAVEQNIELDSYSTYEDGKRSINIIYENNFGDTYTIIHEILHDMNLLIPEDCNEENEWFYETRDVFTEMISFLGTCVAKQYFEKNLKNTKELDIDLSDDYNGLYNKRFEMEFAIYLIKKFCKNGCVTNYDIYSDVSLENAKYQKIISDYLEMVLKNEDLFLFYNERYLTGIMITDYILNNYKKPEVILKELNVLISSKLLTDIFDYLDLEVELDKERNLIRINKDSLKKIEDSFKQQVKKLY